MDGHVVLRVVCDVDLNSIAFSNINCRPRIHPVYGNYGLRMAQPTHILHLNLNKKRQIRTKLFFMLSDQC